MIKIYNINGVFLCLPIDVDNSRLSPTNYIAAAARDNTLACPKGKI